MPKFPKKSISQAWKSFKDLLSAASQLLKLYWQTEPKLFLLNLLAVTLPAVMPFILAYLFKLIIDLVIISIQTNSIDWNQFIYLVGLIFVVDYITQSAYTLQSYIQKIFWLKFPLTIYQIVINKIASLNMQYYEDSNFRDLLEKVRESYTYRPHQMVNILMFTIQSLVQISIALVAIIQLNIWLAILMLIMALPTLLNQIYFSKFSWFIWNQKTPQRKRMSYLVGLVETTESIKELKIFQLTSRFIAEIKSTQESYISENSRIATKQFKVNSGLNFIDSLAGIGLAIYIVIQALFQRITIGDISFYQNVVGNFNNGINGLFRNLTDAFDNSLYINSIFEMLKLESTMPMVEHPIKRDFNQTPLIEFKNVSFSYPGTKVKVFNNFSLIIEPGQKIALVGENGAGKSTLIKLLARFYDVDEGEILIDGVNLKELDLDSWYKSMGILFQDFIRYEYPAKDNIFFGRAWEQENLEQIIAAARSAGADPMIRKFDHEYQQMLGKTFEGGVELSGGQWQKIALARAFFRNAPVLVLDEPTAAIDAKAESEIFSRVERLSKSKTVIIISHRFSTVRNADKIYVIEKGQIVEAGDHQQLMKIDGKYARLFKLQAKGYQ